MPDEAELAVAFYNEEAEKHGYQRCTKLTPELRVRLEKRLRGIGGLASFKRAVLAVPRHRFLSGRARPRDGDDRPFKLTIQILLRTQTSKGEPWDVLAELLDLAADASDHHPADELREYIVEQTNALEALGIDLSPAPKAKAKKH